MLKHTFAAALLGIATLCAINIPAHAEDVIVTRHPIVVRHRPVVVREYVPPVRHYVYAPSYYTYDPYYSSYYYYPRPYYRPGVSVNYYGGRHRWGGFGFGFHF